jgi:hypothetical protein
MVIIMVPFYMNRRRFPFPTASPSPCHLCASPGPTFCSASHFTLLTLLQKSEKTNPLFSNSSPLFQKECFNNSFPLNHFRTLLQNTGGGVLSVKIISPCSTLLASRRSPQTTKSRRIRTSAKHTRNPFRIRTSKTRHLKSFRIRTCRKTPGGEGRLYFLTSLHHYVRFLSSSTLSSTELGSSGIPISHRSPHDRSN